MAELTYRQAVAAALAQEMARDDRVVLLGEDVGSGGVFKTTGGLRERFGADRVWDTPISEQAIAGAAMGAAMAGLRPVAEIMFSDFYATCWDQVANEIAKVRYMTGGQVSVPLVLRGANGSGGLGFGSQHGQSVENWAMTVPGLKIASPAGPAEAFGLLAAAIRDDDPVMVFEHKALYGRKEEIGDGEQVVSLGQARIVRPGDVVTLVGLSITVGSCLAAAAELAAEGIEAEVIDLRTLVPLDAATVLESVARTGRLVVVEENPGQLGWGASIAAIAAQEAFGSLAAPVTRVSGGNVPLPVAASLEAEVDVSVPRVVMAVRGVLGARATRCQSNQCQSNQCQSNQCQSAERLRSMEIRGEDVLLPVSAVSAFPRPHWLQGRVLGSLSEPVYRSHNLRVAYEDACHICADEQEKAGLDILCDGAQYYEWEAPGFQLEPIFHFIPENLGGFRPYGPPGEGAKYRPFYQAVVKDKITWERPIFESVVMTMQNVTDKPFKVAFLGPAQQSVIVKDEYYGDQVAVARDLAIAMNQELKYLVSIGLEAVQLIDVLPPYTTDMWQIEMQNIMFDGVDAIKFWHVCYGSVDGQRDIFDNHAASMMPLFKESPADVIHLEFTNKGFDELAAFRDFPTDKVLGVGVVDAKNLQVETPEQIEARIRRGLEVVPADRLLVAPDCGLGYFSRTAAYAKLRNMGQAAATVRSTL